jgi:hypothetical protein
MAWNVPQRTYSMGYVRPSCRFSRLNQTLAAFAGGGRPFPVATQTTLAIRETSG